MTDPDKVREDRLRRMATRQGLLLRKSRRRDPRAIDFGGYMLVNVDCNMVELGATLHGFDATLDEVERYLMQDAE